LVAPQNQKDIRSIRETFSDLSVSLLTLSEAENYSSSGSTRDELADVVLDEMDNAHGLLRGLSNRINLQIDSFSDQLAKNASWAQTVEIVIFLLGLLVMISISTWLSKALRSTLFQLQKGAMRLADGDLSFQIDRSADKTVGPLIDAFNEMGVRLEKKELDLSQSSVSLDYLDNLLDSMAEALIVIDARLTITRVNRAAIRLFATDGNNLIGSSVQALFAQDSEFEVEQLTDQHEYQLITKEKNVFPASISVSNLKDSSNVGFGGKNCSFTIFRSTCTSRKIYE
jgi:PAS domain S-box-containing protein